MQISSPEIDVIDLAKIPKDEAEKRILSYINSHVGCRTGDIIYDLGLDPDLVIDSLRELELAKRIAGKEIVRE